MRILAFLARRLGIFAVSLLGASALVFAVCSALPGEVAEIILGEGATPAQIEALTARLGLDRPPLVRYLEWVGGMLHGDFGTSFFTGQNVLQLMAPRIAVTLWLVGAALLLSIVIAVPVGMLAAMKRRSWIGFVTSGAAQLGMAIPAFWAAIALVLVFAVGLRWLPANGYVPLATNPSSWAAHLVLPVVSLAIVQASVLVRYVRSAFIEVLSEDYYRTVIGLQLAGVLVGAIVIESVFALPGLGSALLDAVSQRDLMIVQGVVMFLATAVLLINFLVDLSYAWIDPRLRTEADR